MTAYITFKQLRDELKAYTDAKLIQGGLVDYDLVFKLDQSTPQTITGLSDGYLSLVSGVITISAIDLSGYAKLDCTNQPFTGHVSGKKCGVFACLSEPEDTTITTAGTYYPIAGTFTNSPIESFDVGTEYTPSIKYTASLTQYFEIDWHASISANVANTTVNIGIKKNDTLVTSSVMGHYLKNSDELYTLSGTCVIELATNDEVQLAVTSDGDGDVITFEHYTTTINEFFD